MRAVHAMILPAVLMAFACEKKAAGTPPTPVPAAANDASTPAAAKSSATAKENPAGAVAPSAPAPTAQDREAAALRSATHREDLVKKRELFDEEKEARKKLVKDKERAQGGVKDFLE